MGTAVRPATIPNITIKPRAVTRRTFISFAPNVQFLHSERMILSAEQIEYNLRRSRWLVDARSAQNVSHAGFHPAPKYARTNGKADEGGNLKISLHRRARGRSRAAVSVSRECRDNAGGTALDPACTNRCRARSSPPRANRSYRSRRAR